LGLGRYQFRSGATIGNAGGRCPVTVPAAAVRYRYPDSICLRAETRTSPLGSGRVGKAVGREDFIRIFQKNPTITKDHPASIRKHFLPSAKNDNREKDKPVFRFLLTGWTRGGSAPTAFNNKKKVVEYGTVPLPCAGQKIKARQEQ
jgi:hypothetical protein